MSVLVVALPLAAIVAALFLLGWAGNRIADRLHGLPGNCTWCAAGRPTARQMAALPSDCRCAKPCGDIACGAEPVKKETDLA